MIYSYQAVGKSGRLVKGSAPAANVAILRSELGRGGLTLVDANRDFLAEALQALKPNRLPRSVMIDLFGYMRGLLAMGLDMISAWGSVADALPDKLAKQTCGSVQEAIRQGYSLAQAMERTGVFPPMVLGNVRAGETSGTLDKVFESLELNFRQQAALSQQVMKATMYPLISVGVLFLIAVGLLTGVVPQLEAIFPPDPPLPTKILLFLSHSVVGYWYLIPLAFFTVAIGWWRTPDSLKGRFWELFYRMPLVGPVLKAVALCNFFDNLSLMLGAGISIISALQTVAEATPSRALRQRIERVLDMVQRGSALADGFRDPFFPQVAAGVIAQGEQTGAIDAYLKRLSGFLRDRAQSQLSTMATLIEPLLLLVGGGMLMLLAVGIFLPIYGSMKNIGH